MVSFVLVQVILSAAHENKKWWVVIDIRHVFGCNPQNCSFGQTLRRLAAILTIG